MANVIRIKRRASNGAAGAPSSLKNAELAFNEADQKLYYGKGADGNGDATEIIAIGGVGWDSAPDLSGYATLAGNNTWSGSNTFNGNVNLESTFQIDAVTVDTSAAELNLLDGALSDSVVAGKAVIYGAAGEVAVTTLTLDGTDVTATAAELNILDGVTADKDELNLLDTAVANTVVNSKAVIYGSSGQVAVTSLSIDGTEVTATAAELNILDGVTADKDELNLLENAVANTVVNSKAVIYGSSGQVAASSLTTTGDVTVGGNLLVSGETLIVNVETVEVEDKNIVLGKVTTPSDATANGGGITLKGTSDKTFNWVDATDAWTSSEHVELAAGKDLMLNGATSGKVTIAVVDNAGTNTATFPAATGTVLLDSTVCAAIADCALDGGTF